MNKVLILNGLPAGQNVTKQNLPMVFNMSEMRRSIGDFQLLTRAELRLLIKNPAIMTEQRVELYEGLEDSARYLASKFLNNDWRDKWLTFDITETLQKWLQKDGRPVCLSVCRPLDLSDCLSIGLSVFIVILLHLSVYRSVCLSVCLSV